MLGWVLSIHEYTCSKVEMGRFRYGRAMFKVDDDQVGVAHCNLYTCSHRFGVTFLFSTEIVLVRCTNTHDSNIQRLLKCSMKTRRCMTDIYNAGQAPDVSMLRHGVHVAWMSPEPRAQQCGSWFSHRTTVRYIRFSSHLISTFVVIHLSVKVNLDNLILWEDIGWTKDYPVRLNEDVICWCSNTVTTDMSCI